MKLLRRLFLSLFFVMFIVFQSQAQDTPFSYLALGDSYTIGEKVAESQRWPVQLAESLRDSGISMGDPHIIAKTGWTTLELREAIAQADLTPPYDLVSLLIGVNDQYDGLNFKKYPDRFRDLVKQAIQLAGGNTNRVLVVSIPDYSVTPFGQEKNPAKISRELKKYNAINKSIAKSYKVHYVNITPGSQKAARDSTLIADDGLHPSGKMYHKWVDQIMPELLPEIKSWPIAKQ